MKILVTKIGANITWSKSVTSAANTDIKYLLSCLDTQTDFDISIISKKTRNTIIPKKYKFINLNDSSFQNVTEEHDVLVVFNGSINFFGGARDESPLNIYRLMNTCSKEQKPIFVINTDGQLILKKLWPMIHKREWATDLSANEFDIDESNVHYISQFRNVNELIRDDAERKKKIVIPKENTMFIDLAASMLCHGKIKGFDPRINYPKLEDRKIDLTYGGYTRNTYRRKRLQHFYFNPILKKLKLKLKLFGNLRDFGIVNRVSPSQFIRIMRSSRATIIVGDKEYENNTFTLRMYESILSGVIVFIDSKFDQKCRFYNGIEGTQNLYIRNTEEFVDSFFSDYNIAEMEELTDKIYEEKYLNFSVEKYTSELASLLTPMS